MKSFTGHLFAAAAIACSLSVAARADEKVDDALKRATQYLLSRQDPADGSISTKERNETAMTALSVLALGSLGHQPGDPTTEGQAMNRALAYVLRSDVQEPDGYFGKKDGS